MNTIISDTELIAKLKTGISDVEKAAIVRKLYYRKYYRKNKEELKARRNQYYIRIADKVIAESD